MLRGNVKVLTLVDQIMMVILLSIRNFHPMTSSSFQFAFWILFNFVYSFNKLRQSTKLKIIQKANWKGFDVIGWKLRILYVFFWCLPLSDVVVNFISLHPGVPGYCVYMDKVCPAWLVSRLLQPESQSSGTSRPPYKRNCRNNSKLLTSRDPGIPGSYKQGLRLNPNHVGEKTRCCSMVIMC